jgi:hypothetical protein
MVFRFAIFAVLLLMHAAVGAQAFKPYPKPRITPAQWETYYKEVEAKLGDSRQIMFADRVIMFHDAKTETWYAFTQADHPAHPAWVARTRVNDGKRIRIVQTGYYAGDQRAFAALFKAHQQVIEKRVKELLSEKKAPPPDSGEAPVDPARRSE